MSVVKCTVIVRPLTHFTIFTDRVLRTIICTIWTVSLIIGGALNAGVTEYYFKWNSMTSHALRQNTVFGAAFPVITFVIPTMIIMTSYTKIFRIVRRQVRRMPAEVLGSFGSRTIFGSSVRSAKNLFVVCVAYWSSYLPVMLRVGLRSKGIIIPDTAEFAISWIYISSSAVNGFLYIILHSSVRRELRRYLPRFRRLTVAPTSIKLVVDGAGQRQAGCVDRNAGAGAGAPATRVKATTSLSQHVTKQLPTVAL